MREILYRGKTPKSREWVYGNYVETSEEYDKDDISYAIMSKENGHRCMGEYCDNAWEEVLPETVGEFTGLLDKNGNRIFVGDIIYLDVSNIYATVQVVFQEGAFGYLYPMTETEFDFMSFSDSEYGIDTQKNVKVLGNIYENTDIKLCKDMGKRKC